jgi:O-methyltransferase
MIRDAIYRAAIAFNYILSVPFSIIFLLCSSRIDPAYRMTWWSKWLLGLKMFRNKHFIQPNGTSFKSLLVMALKILETPPDRPGIIVECGTWKGGSAASLSLVCRITGRKLYIFDSFEGLPAPDPRDREGPAYHAGEFLGTLAEVRKNVTRYGAIECCEFVKGWFSDTLPTLKDDVVLVYLDVDLEASLHDCVRYLWPRLIDGGYIFTDEAVSVNYTALFYSEKWWEMHFHAEPPGLIGAGSGLALGEYYVGPWNERTDHPLQHATAVAYTRKGMTGVWKYFG